MSEQEASEQHEQQASGPRAGSLLVIFLTVFIDLLGFGMVLPLLPIYADQFTIDESGWSLGLLMASFSAMQLVFAPFWGRLSDRIGRRPVLMIGLAGSVVFYLLFAVGTMTTSFALLFLSRLGAGAAGATISTAQAYIADTTSKADRPKGMALIGVAFGLGFTFGPLVGFLAVPTGQGDPGPIPGFVAAGLSAVALVMAIFMLPESLRAESKPAGHKFFDLSAMRRAIAVPSIGPLLLTLFVCVFSFAGFETTLSLLIKGSERAADSPFQFTWGQVCLTFAYIGFTLALVQGGIVRRLAGRVDEGVMAIGGAALQIVGFGLVIGAVRSESVALLMAALAVIVTGFAFLQPSLNSLISRRSSSTDQGAILGVGQSVNSLARIVGSAIAIPLMRVNIETPYYTAAGLMALGLVLAAYAWRVGGDFGE